MQNIDLFNEYAARILAQLYEIFPSKQTLDARTISGHTDVNRFGIICAPDGSESKEARLAYDTIEWLVHNGYVRADSLLDGRLAYGCRLTEQGRKVLRAVPEKVQNTETRGRKLVRLIKESSIEAAISCVKEILMRGAAGAI